MSREKAFADMRGGWRWLTGDVSWQDYGGKWVKQIGKSRAYVCLSFDNGSACQCGETCNQQFAAGEIVVNGDDDGDAAILAALFESSHLSEKGRAECVLVAYGDGVVDVNDADGRRIYHLEIIES